MNRRPLRSVDPRVSRCLAVIAIACAAAGCVEIEGGAVELSWTLRDFDGGPNECEPARIDRIRLCWTPLMDGGPGTDPECQAVVTDGGVEQRFRSFECDQYRGVTRFEVPPGPTALFVAPLCLGGAEPTGRLQVPPPIVRTVIEGEVVTLNQLLILAGKCPGADCSCP